MAEKYGTVPKKFTKSWWEYFWMYYKWHTIIIAFLVITIGTTVYQNLTKEKYDLTLMYAGRNIYSETEALAIEDALSPLCTDVDKNGESSLYFSQLNLDVVNDADPQYMMAMVTKLQLSLGEDDIYFYIMDEPTATFSLGEDTENPIFTPVKDWLKSDKNLDTFSVNGIDFGIKVNDIEIFKNMDVNFDDQYLFVRYYPRDDQEDQIAGYKATLKLLNEIIR